MLYCVSTIFRKPPPPPLSGLHVNDGCVLYAAGGGLQITRYVTISHTKNGGGSVLYGGLTLQVNFHTTREHLINITEKKAKVSSELCVTGNNYIRLLLPGKFINGTLVVLWY